MSDAQQRKYLDDVPEEPGFQGQAFISPSIGLFVLLLGGVFLAAKISAMRDERKVAEQSPAGDGLTGRT